MIYIVFMWFTLCFNVIYIISSIVCYIVFYTICHCATQNIAARSHAVFQCNAYDECY